MKKVYIAHSRQMDYEKEIYEPIRNEESLKAYDVILPHEVKQENNQGRDFYKTLDIMIAEVSMPATGLGIELGWAYDSQVPIYCLHKKDCKPTSSIYAVTNEVYAYQNKEELIELVKTIIKK